MTTLHLPSGLVEGIDFLIDANWTPEQAAAVFELIDDLREQIWRRYGAQIQAVLREQRGTGGRNGCDAGVEEPF